LWHQPHQLLQHSTAQHSTVHLVSCLRVLAVGDRRYGPAAHP
jgi:hypothetical protein